MTRRLRALLGREAGFTLVELTVAMLLAVILMMAVAGTMRGALANSRANRLRQQATSVAMEAFEYSRSLGWDHLALDEIDPLAPLIDAGTGTLLASLSGLPSDEDLLVCPTGSLPPKSVITQDGVTFTAWLYVTEVNPSLRRVMVDVRWVSDGQPFSHRSESVVSIVSAGGITAVDQPVFPEAAIVATGNVSLVPGSTVSNPPTAHSASIWLNQSFSNLDAVVDGDIVAGGVVNATPANVYGTIQQNAGTPVNVPTVAEIEAWRSGMRAEAQGGTTHSGNLVVSGGTIQAPMYVTGTLEFQGSVHITGEGPVLATSMIRLQAGSVVTIDGAHLVSDSTIVFESGAEMRVSEPTAGGVVSFATSTQALSVRGGDPGTVQGLAYAPYGGVTLAGTEPWHGSLVAHGANGLGVVSMAGGASVEYPANLLPTTAIVSVLRPPVPVSVCG